LGTPLAHACGRRLPLRLALPTLTTLLLLVSFTAQASASNEKSSSGEHDDYVIAGIKGVTVSEISRTHEGTESLTGYGAAGFGEATLLHDRLALELDFVVTTPGNELSWATEPLIKVPIHVSRWFEPYAAAGPMVVHVRDDLGRRYWLGGGQLVVGAYAWLAHEVGLDIDVSVGAAQGPDMTVMELVFAVGPMLRE
jgi:hypothetical protein